MKFNDLNTEELMNINGGYSWKEFKEDVNKVVDAFVSSGAPVSTPENPWMR